MARCQVTTGRGARCKRTAKVCIDYCRWQKGTTFDLPRRHRHVCNGHRLKDREQMAVIRVVPIALCARKKPKQ